MVAPPIGPAMYRSEPRPRGLPPCAPGSACLAHFLAGLAHVMPEIPLGLAKFCVPFAKRPVHAAAPRWAGVRHLTHSFGARPPAFGQASAPLLAAFPAPVRQGGH